MSNKSIAEKSFHRAGNVSAKSAIKTTLEALGDSESTGIDVGQVKGVSINDFVAENYLIECYPLLIGSGVC